MSNSRTDDSRYNFALRRAESEMSQISEFAMSEAASTISVGPQMEEAYQMLGFGNETSVSFEDVKIVQSTWIDMTDRGLDLEILSDVFRWIVDCHPDMLPQWPFARSPQSYAELRQQSDFKSYVTEMSSGINKIVVAMPGKKAKTFLQKLGKKHLYYNAVEPHFEAVKFGFLHILHQYVEAGRVAMPPLGEQAWIAFVSYMMTEIETAIGDERELYVHSCLNETEMVTVVEIWSAMKSLGEANIGKLLCQVAIQQYKDMSGTELTYLANMSQDQRLELSRDLIAAFDAVIDNLPHNVTQLPQYLIPFVKKYRVIGVIPYYAKMALKNAFVHLLKQAIGRRAREPILRTWTKLYEVFVQATIHCIMKASSLGSLSL